MQEYLKEELEEKEGRLSAIIEALQEVEFVVNSIRSNHKLTDDELLTAYQRITDPLFLYAHLLNPLSTT